MLKVSLFYGDNGHSYFSYKSNFSWVSFVAYIVTLKTPNLFLSHALNGDFSQDSLQPKLCDGMPNYQYGKLVLIHKELII